jgi:hypothetical protein
MSYNRNLIENCANLAYFEHLKNENKLPQIALYRGRTLMIISYKADGFLEKIALIFLKAEIAIYQFFKLLEVDKTKIGAIQSQVAQYHFLKCKNLRDNLVESKEATYSAIAKENDDLKIKNSKLIKENKSYNKALINFEILKKQLKEESTLLKDGNNFLKEENAKLKETNNALTRDTIEILDVSEMFVAKYQDLSNKMKDLESENSILKRTLNSIQTEIKIEDQIKNTVDLSTKMDIFLHKRKNVSNEIDIPK